MTLLLLLLLLHKAHGPEDDVIKGEGLLQYGQDLGITEDTDPGLMLIAWKCNVHHEKSWEMTRDEFVGGWALHG